MRQALRVLIGAVLFFGLYVVARAEPTATAVVFYPEANDTIPINSQVFFSAKLTANPTGGDSNSYEVKIEFYREDPAGIESVLYSTTRFVRPGLGIEVTYMSSTTIVDQLGTWQFGVRSQSRREGSNDNYTALASDHH